MKLKCDICYNLYSSKQTLYEHKKNVHHIYKVINDKTCKFCNKELYNAQSCKRHEKKCRFNSWKDYIDFEKLNQSMQEMPYH